MNFLRALSGWWKRRSTGTKWILVLTVLWLWGVILSLRENAGVVDPPEAERARSKKAANQKEPLKKVPLPTEPAEVSIDVDDVRLRVPPEVEGFRLTSVGFPHIKGKTHESEATKAEFSPKSPGSRFTLLLDRKPDSSLGLTDPIQVKVGTSPGLQSVDGESQQVMTFWRRGAFRFFLYSKPEGAPWNASAARKASLAFANEVDQFASTADLLDQRQRSDRVAELKAPSRRAASDR